VALPAIVNSGDDESRRALTPDGRYVGFVRHTSDGHSRLFIWDSLTQLLVNNSGIDLGVLSPREIDLTVAQGNLTLEVAPVLQLTSISFNSGARERAAVHGGGDRHPRSAWSAISGCSAGGGPGCSWSGASRSAISRRGHVRIRWDRKVDGRKLQPGLYQITVRPLASNGRIEDLGRPSLVRIRRQERHLPVAQDLLRYPRSRPSISYPVCSPLLAGKRGEALAGHRRSTRSRRR
jgi:hypothetical protein